LESGSCSAADLPNFKEEWMKEPTGKTKSSARSSPRAVRRAPAKEAVLFEYFDPSAKIVTVAGDFNQWNPTVRPMKRDAGGLWKVKVRLDPGSYQYKFVVNGERWEEDPLNLHRAINEHGTFNSIRNVGANSEGNLGRT
jgi:1,4-alpha-glucan branching enzyme